MDQVLCKQVDERLQSRTMNTITIEVMGQQEVYDLLCILDFDNVRKRMSVSHQEHTVRWLIAVWL